MYLWWGFKLSFYSWCRVINGLYRCSMLVGILFHINWNPVPCHMEWRSSWYGTLRELWKLIVRAYGLRGERWKGERLKRWKDGSAFVEVKGWKGEKMVAPLWRWKSGRMKKWLRLREDERLKRWKDGFAFVKVKEWKDEKMVAPLWRWKGERVKRWLRLWKGERVEGWKGG